MFYIFGDSHALFSFKNLSIPHENKQKHSVTMFRIGRDNIIPNFNINLNGSNNSFILCYGEIDCRCHLGKQVKLGRQEDEIILQLVDSYFQTIKNNIKTYKNIYIVGVIPPVSQIEHEKIHGPITHEFPFVGTDEDRIRYTSKINTILEEFALKNNFYYFNPYEYYTRKDGILKRELSDNNCHLGDNSYFLYKFNEIVTQTPFEERYA